MGDSDDIFGGGPEGEGETPRPSAAELEAEGQESMFGAPADAPPPNPSPVAAPEPSAQAAPSPEPVAAPAEPAAAAPAQPYRVLARKYRPQTFSQLIGQEAMVQTLANAIRRDRLAHAFLMTGVRGVGKTSTARLIAKALNCIGPDGEGGPTIDPCGVCEPCRAIAEGRHIDVIEMDAASHTGVDDVREIIEAVRYAAVSARYKIYIIDEVHMLSRNAFNALLKTLEEPPAHVKFLFATTEVEKLPVTVLSRCQRFDLRRIPTEMLQQHFAGVCKAEGVEAEEEALRMVSAAAEGSVRDGLSILDQAISHADMSGGGIVTAEQVRDMLGLADKAMQRRVFEALLGGDGGALLDEIGQQYALGVEPLALMRAQLDLVHRITVAQIGGSGADAKSAEERDALDGWSRDLSAAQLHRLWQLLLKGHDEVKGAPDPLPAAQMALLRVMHASDMPDPGQLVKRIEEIAARAPAAPAGDAQGGGAAPAQPSAPAPAAVDWQALIGRVEHTGLLRVSQIMHDWVRIVELGEGILRYQLAPGFSEDVAPELRDALLRATGTRWQVEHSAGNAQPSLREREEAEKQSAHAAMLADPLVKAAFEAFPDAELVDEGRPDDNTVTPWSRRA
ncbi:DNA polymerase III subunit gamma/tau [Novosphingobium sp. ZN18A2]|uniref:DNA polymerase III subunit gamma/tau n=1 Tax=Novosphingobium sp. ZN18A2 TaxID=3079861 RepID=UPI0030CDCB73